MPVPATILRRLAVIFAACSGLLGPLLTCGVSASSSPTSGGHRPRSADRRIGVLIPNSAASLTSSPPSSPSLSSHTDDGQSPRRVNADDLERLGVGPDEVEKYVRRLREDDVQLRQQQSHQRGPRHPNSRSATAASSGTSSGLHSHRHHHQQHGSKLQSTVPDNRAELNLLRRHFIRNRTVTCNDGSRAGYYIRKAQGTSRRWIIFLEGGWMCFDQLSCRSRWLNTPNLMSSERWPYLRAGSGILSSDPDENPFIHDGTMVHIPYCSSDAWSGSYKARKEGEYSFLGAAILNEVMTDLVALHGLGAATDVFLAGSSAGGTGVLLNLDRTAQLLAQIAPSVKLRGIADSGWFIDNNPYRHHPCTDYYMCAPTELVQRGIQLWQGQVPDECRARYPGQAWKCYFGYRIYSTLHTIVFVVQHLFDEAQIMSDNVGPPVHGDQWQYIYRLGLDIRHSLTNVSAVFAPACMSHILLTRREWDQLSVNGVSLSSALSCWESGLHESNHYSNNHRSTSSSPTYNSGGSGGRQPALHSGNDWNHIRNANVERRQSSRKSERLQADQADGDVVNQRRKGNRRQSNLTSPKIRHGRHRRKRRQRMLTLPPANSSSNHSMTSFDHSRRPLSRVSPTPLSVTVRRSRRAVVFDEHDIHRLRHHPPDDAGSSTGCYHRLVDRCVWPQCNQGCPSVRNPFTGGVLDLVDLMATQLGSKGVSTAADRDRLRALLTETARKR